MTQYATDFSEYTTGVKPSDWTLRSKADDIWKVREVVGTSGGKVLRLEEPTPLTMLRAIRSLTRQPE